MYSQCVQVCTYFGMITGYIHKRFSLYLNQPKKLSTLKQLRQIIDYCGK